ncbi:MAG: zinc ABC transporter substrate-binding protein [Candidatus Dormiibacterota bacterium]
MSRLTDSRDPVALGTLSLLVALAATSCCTGLVVQASSTNRTSKIVAVGAENEYANVIGQVGGRYVTVAAVMSNPNTDPHTFEASPKVAEMVSAAELVVQNGLGYDAFMNKIEAASPNSRRKVIEVQNLLGLPSNTPNPHLWYKPTTMPAVAKAVASDLGKLEPAHAVYFRARARTFDQSLTPWYRVIAQIKAKFPKVAVATTEPVGDYLLQAVGADNRTPWTLQADIMNGVDPSPQEVTFQDNLFKQHRVKAFLYNQQVTDSLTAAFLALAKQNRVPVVGVYETMPTPGYDYQTWMIAEAKALDRALADQQSTTRL